MTHESPEGAQRPSVDETIDKVWSHEGEEAIREIGEISANIQAMPERHTQERFKDGRAWAAQGGVKDDERDTMPGFGVSEDDMKG